MLQIFNFLDNFVHISHNKGGQQLDQKYVVTFSKKKILFRTMGHFDLKNGMSSELWILFLILHNEGGQEIHESYFNSSFPKNSSSGQVGHFMCKKDAWSQLSESTVRIFVKFCTIKETRRYIKIILMVFLKKVVHNERDQEMHENWINGFS